MILLRGQGETERKTIIYSMASFQYWDKCMPEDKKKEIENLWNDKQVKLAGLHTACLYLIAKANI